MKNRVWIISEVYYPDESGGGHFMTEVAEGLAQFYNVKVLCGYPVNGQSDDIFAARETHNGVDIERCPSTNFDKNNFFLRLINMITISISIFIKALRKIRRNDLVIVVTTPPSLPFVMLALCRLIAAKCVVRIEDVYPETLIATGLINEHQAFAKLLFHMNEILYESADHITVLGRDMKLLVEKRLNKHEADKHITVVPNWADLELIVPEQKSDNTLLYELGLQNKFVVQCAGNMGLAQGMEDIFKAVEGLKNEQDIHFLFIGSGAKRKWMEQEVADKKLTNVTLLNQRPRADQPNFLNACDVAIVSLLPKMTGAGVPSRMYNIMAAGKPIIAFAEKDSELSIVVEEEGIGWSVSHRQPYRLIEIILFARSNPAAVLEMGRKSRAVVEQKYSPNIGIQTYCSIIERLYKNN